MYAVMFLWLVFYDFIETNVPFVNYWDELAACLVLCWGAYDFWKQSKLQKGEPGNWLCLFALVVIGALGSILRPDLQPQKAAVVKDVVALIKFPVIFFVLQRRTVMEETREKTLPALQGSVAGFWW